jgi:hypothetical protein
MCESWSICTSTRDSVLCRQAPHPVYQTCDLLTTTRLEKAQLLSERQRAQDSPAMRDRREIAHPAQFGMIDTRRWDL